MACQAYANKQINPASLIGRLTCSRRMRLSELADRRDFAADCTALSPITEPESSEADWSSNAEQSSIVFAHCCPRADMRLSWVRIRPVQPRQNWRKLRMSCHFSLHLFVQMSRHPRIRQGYLFANFTSCHGCALKTLPAENPSLSWYCRKDGLEGAISCHLPTWLPSILVVSVTAPQSLRRPSGCDTLTLDTVVDSAAD